jgi:hypothetical protein
MRLLRFLLFILLLCGISFASDNKFVRISPEFINTQLKNVPSEPAERVRMMRAKFMLAGCGADQITEQAVPGEAVPNIFCTLPGKEEGTIVIAARLDYKSKGDELVVDNATLNLLPLLAQSLQTTGRRYSFVFIALTGGDRHKGSAYYLSQLTAAEKKSIRGFVLFDRLGRSYARYLFATQENVSEQRHASGTILSERSSHPDSMLRKQLLLAARSVKMEDPNEFEDFYFTDALNFERQHILALALTSPAYTILIRDVGRHQVKLVRTEVDMQVYYETYNMLCVYMLNLDNTLEAKK